MLTPSPQQQNIFDFIKNSNKSLIIEAGAGCGKTSTLVEVVKIINNKSIAFCAFNKSIVKEIKYKTEDLSIPGLKVGTVHSFGFGIYRKFQSRVRVEGNKLRDLAYQEFTGQYEEFRQFAVDVVEIAKQVGIGCLQEIEDDKAWYDMCDHFDLFDSLPTSLTTAEGIDAAKHLLRANNSIKHIIDYSDMVYLPIVNKMRAFQYDYVLLDEAQDTNPVRRALVRMILKPGGRLIAVGDKRQAIYGFTGADADALDKIKEEFNSESLPLSVTYRCPKEVVKFAYNWVDESVIQAHESAPEGIIDTIELADIHNHVGPYDAILCRNTKPLVELAYSLLRRQIACKVEGRAIGEGLIKIAQKWKTVKNVGQLASKVEDWKEKEITKHRAKGNDSRCQVIEDQADTLEVFMLQCEDSDPISLLVANIRKMFGDTEQGEQKVLTLSTIHKAKGREWDRVFALGMDTYSPSKYAIKEWELGQENHLCYVQVTRSKKHLTNVIVPRKNKD